MSLTNPVYVVYKCVTCNTIYPGKEKTNECWYSHAGLRPVTLDEDGAEIPPKYAYGEPAKPDTTDDNDDPMGPEYEYFD